MESCRAPMLENLPRASLCPGISQASLGGSHNMCNVISKVFGNGPVQDTCISSRDTHIVASTCAAPCSLLFDSHLTVFSSCSGPSHCEAVTVWMTSWTVPALHPLAITGLLLPSPACRTHLPSQWVPAVTRVGWSPQSILAPR